MRFIGAFALLALVVTGCGGDDSAGCLEVREPEDPQSIQHTLDPDSVTYLTDPPTSGPHLSGPAPSGLLASPLIPAAQVNVLEGGGILVQYTAPVTEADVAALLSATDAPLTIAPSTGLPATVVATAWTWKLTCDSVDIEALTTFAESRGVDAPGDD